jgi:hypothetical protein
VKTQPSKDASIDASADGARLRRIALDRQGLLKNAPFGRGSAATLKAIEHLGYVQIDTISVVARAQHHVLRSRVPNYDPAHLDRLQDTRRIFEYWYHAAAYLPMRDYRFALPKMAAMARREDRWIRSHDDRLMADVLRHVAGEGPTRARDFETPATSGERGWWNWKPAKRALEQLFMQGDLMVVGRDGFEKIYDLRDNVLPDGVDTRMPDDEELAAHLLDNALRSHGFATRKTVTYQRPGTALRKALDEVIRQRVAGGRLLSVTLPDGAKAYAEPEILAARSPPAPARVRVLSPFDNAVIQRERGQSVFDFDYQIECYVPAEKRRFGYFCLPLLFRDRFIGRADCKAHRQAGRLEIKALHVEDERPLRAEPEAFADALGAALSDFAAFNGCADVHLGSVTPSSWAGTLARAVG